MRLEFAHDGGGVGKGGTATIYSDGVVAGEGRIDQTEAFLLSADVTCEVGDEYGSPVTTDDGVTRFTGEVEWVQIELGLDDRNHMIKPEDRVRLAMGIQSRPPPPSRSCGRHTVDVDVDEAAGLVAAGHAALDEGGRPVGRHVGVAVPPCRGRPRGRTRCGRVTAEVDRTYVEQRDEQADMDAIVGVRRMMGLLIVAVSMLGLVNALTSVIERTREIGVKRSIGARGRGIRRAFTAESLTLVAAGWLIGVPVGWPFLQGMRVIARSLTDMDIPSVFPLANLPLVPVGTAVLALAAPALPRRRAVRMRPGAALRYR